MFFCFFAIQGFGRIVPYSDLGKLVTMLYALPTIGLTLVLYAYGADVLLMLSYIGTAKFERRMRSNKNVTVCKYKTSMIQISIALISFFLMTIILIIDGPSDRSTLDSFYLCFISVTTIGFGDITYNSKLHLIKTPWWYLPQLIFFLLTMSIVASALSAISDILKKNELGRWVSRKASSNSSTAHKKKEPLPMLHNDGKNRENKGSSIQQCC